METHRIYTIRFCSDEDPSDNDNITDKKRAKPQSGNTHNCARTSTHVRITNWILYLAGMGVKHQNCNTHTSTHTLIWVYVHICMYVYMYVCIYVHAYLNAYKCTYMYIHICICTCKYIYIYTYEHIYIYIHIHIFIFINSRCTFGLASEQNNGIATAVVFLCWIQPACKCVSVCTHFIFQTCMYVRKCLYVCIHILISL